MSITIINYNYEHEREEKMIDFTYDKHTNIDFVQGYINKGKNYRESIIKYPSLYKYPKKEQK